MVNKLHRTFVDCTELIFIENFPPELVIDIHK